MSTRRALAAIKRVVKRLKLKGHLHTFRHSFISNALANGTTVTMLKSWVGHVSDKILALYTHVSDTDSTAAMQRLVERLEETKTKQDARESEGIESVQFQHNRG
jgi:integrase